MKKFIIPIAFGALFSVANAQSKHENWYRQVNPVKTDQVNIEISNSHSQEQFSKFKMKVTNNTKDYILIKPEEMVFEYEHGKFSPKDKVIIISPYKSTSAILTVDGNDKFHVEKYTVHLNGFYLVPADGSVAAAENFKLPANKNNFTAGPFDCKVDGEIVKVTKVTQVPFKCKYTGKTVAIIDETNAVVLLENGTEYVNKGGGSGGLKSMFGGNNLLFPGEDKKVTTEFKVPGKVVDMQFANMEIVWKNTFTESTLNPFSVPDVSFELDPGMTEGKNK